MSRPFFCTKKEWPFLLGVFAYVIGHLDSDVGNLALNFPSIFTSSCGNEKRNPLMRFPFFGVDDAVSKDVVATLAVQAEIVVVPVS